VGIEQGVLDSRECLSDAGDRGKRGAGTRSERVGQEDALMYEFWICSLKAPLQLDPVFTDNAFDSGVLTRFRLGAQTIVHQLTDIEHDLVGSL
jgi:hypothetical protein